MSFLSSCAMFLLVLCTITPLAFASAQPNAVRDKLGTTSTQTRLPPVLGDVDNSLHRRTTHLNRHDALEAADPVQSQMPSYEPVFYVFAVAALICLAVLLHILYLEWKKKHLSQSDTDQLTTTRDTVDGQGHIMIPMTLQQRNFPMNMPRVESFDLHTPQMRSSKSQGMVAFESVAKK